MATVLSSHFVIHYHSNQLSCRLLNSRQQTNTMYSHHILIVVIVVPVNSPVFREPCQSSEACRCCKQRIALRRIFAWFNFRQKFCSRVHVHVPDPGTGYHVAPLERSWSLGSAPARECSRHPCRITGREGTAIGYLP